MTALAFHDWADEIEWAVPRPSGGRVTCTRSVGTTVVRVDRTQEQPVPPGARLLDDFLDEFESHPDVAAHLVGARQEIARDGIAGKGYASIVDLRLAAGLSQKELAVALNTSQSMVSLLEARKQKPGEETIRALARVLGTDFNTLMDALDRG